MSAAAETLKLEGPLSYESLPRVLAESAQYEARADLPDRLTIDFTGVTDIDSSAVALLLEWRRRAAALGKTLVFANLPPNLLALAGLYGVDDLIRHCEAN